MNKASVEWTGERGIRWSPGDGVRSDHIESQRLLNRFEFYSVEMKIISLEKWYDMI